MPQIDEWDEDMKSCPAWAPIPSLHVPLLPVLLTFTGQTHCKVGTTSTLSSSSTGKFKSKPRFTVYQGSRLAAPLWDAVGLVQAFIWALLSVLMVVHLRLLWGWDGSPAQTAHPEWEPCLEGHFSCGKKGSSQQKHICSEWWQAESIRRTQPWLEQMGFPDGLSPSLSITFQPFLPADPKIFTSFIICTPRLPPDSQEKILLPCSAWCCPSHFLPHLPFHFSAERRCNCHSNHTPPVSSKEFCLYQYSSVKNHSAVNLGTI